MDETRLAEAMAALEGTLDEVETVKKYMVLLADMPDNQAQADMREIIADELEHVERFMNIFIEASGISPSED